MFTFGDIPPGQGDVPVAIALSDDRRAVTINFSEGAGVEAGANTPAIGTRLFSHVLPLVGSGRAEIEFALQTGVVLDGGTTATILLSVNGQSVVTDLTRDPDETVVQSLTFVAEDPTECRLVAFLVAGRDSQSQEGGGDLRFLAVDAEMLPRAPGPKGA